MTATLTPAGLDSPRGTGWLKDPPDHRDHLAGAPAPGAPLPTTFNLRSTGFVSAVKDQGATESCTAHAATDALEFAARKHGEPVHARSRMYLYYEGRKLDNLQGQDAGAYIRSVIKAGTLGVPPETSWTFTAEHINTEPSTAAQKAAAHWKELAYSRVNGDMPSLKWAMVAGYPVVFGVRLHQSFYGTGPDGIVRMPSGDPEVGGHAMLMVGWVDSRSAFLVKNSWSSRWGWQGYCWLPFDYINLYGDGDYWTVTRVHR